MRHHLPPRGVLIIGGVLIVAWWYFRRRAKAAEADATNANSGGIALSAIPASFTYLSSAAPTPTERPIGSLNPLDAAALQMLQTLTTRLAGSSGGATSTSGGTVGVSSSPAGLDKQGLGGFLDPNDFARGHSVAGYSVSQIAAIARGQAPTYNGARFVPHNLATEGEIFTDSRGRYINVKFIDPRAIANRSTSTEKVYLP